MTRDRWEQNMGHSTGKNRAFLPYDERQTLGERSENSALSAFLKPTNDGFTLTTVNCRQLSSTFPGTRYEGPTRWRCEEKR